MEERNKKIAFLNQEIESKDKIISELQKKLHDLKKQKSGLPSSRRTHSFPEQLEDEEISLLEGVKKSKK